MTDTSDNIFWQAHQPLESQLRRHLLAVVGGDFADALHQLQHWQRVLQAHMVLEETWLFPHIPDGARWAARVYQLEHTRITALAADYLRVVQAVAAKSPIPREQARAASLHVLDAAHALRHLLEHHHQREEKALAQELPQALQHDVLLGAKTNPPAR